MGKAKKKVTQAGRVSLAHKTIHPPALLFNSAAVQVPNDYSFFSATVNRQKPVAISTVLFSIK